MTEKYGSASASYTYDNQGQLLTETAGGTTWTYTYDTYGNLRSRTNGTTTDTYSYGNTQWLDLLTAYNGNAISYDAIGNPTTWYDGTTFTWVNGRRLASATNTDENLTATYTYDSDGLRLTKTVGGVEHKYLWQGGKLVSEYYGGKQLEFFYDESGNPYAFSYKSSSSASPVTYYYLTNLQGDITGILNSSGTSVATYTYNAWGKLLSSSGSMANINPLRYRGYYYDAELGMYYLKSRYYDPEICRFINADNYASNGQGFLGCNSFVYCLNNPVVFIDENGQYSREAAVDYAREWYNRHNSEYYHYKTDCANFVSQCMSAGEIEMTDNWFCTKTKKTSYTVLDLLKSWLHSNYRYNWNISPAWRLANDQYSYFSNPNNGYINGDVITISSVDDIADIAANGGIQPGDLLYFSGDGITAHHATIITKVDDSMIYYAGHTNPAFDKPLSSGIGNDTVFIIKLSDDA